MSRWYVATVRESRSIAENVVGLTVHIPDWPGHLSGQHCDVRLTATDGYQAERKYSLASPAGEHCDLEFGIQHIPSGEVSPYLCHMRVGEQLEIRGPLGGYFIWQAGDTRPLVLIGGGSGLVPLMSMLRTRQSARTRQPTILIVSARTLSRVLYYEELMHLAQSDPSVRVVITLTDVAPEGWQSYTRRIDREMLGHELAAFLSTYPDYFICGPTPFVEAVTDGLVALDVSPSAIRTERFGGA